MNKRNPIPGINIQWPWSRLLLSGEKTIETRSYPLPEKYKNIDLALIETPGPSKDGPEKSKTMVIGTVRFARSFKYESKQHWLNDFKKHLVPPDHQTFSFQPHLEKWGWVIADVQMLPHPVVPPSKRGRIYARECELE